VTSEQEKDLPQFCPGGATGFLMHICNKTLLISNRHVFSSGRPGPLFVRFKKKNGEQHRFAIGRNWRAHPDNWIDIAASAIELPSGMSMTDFIDQYETASFNEDTGRTSNTPSTFFMSLDDVRVGDDVMFLGFPLSIPEVQEILKTKSVPLMRSGVVSMKLPGNTKLLKTTVNNVLFVDSWAFQRNSGSPVFSRPTIGSYEGDRPHLKRSRPFIIGIISGFLPWPVVSGIGVNSGLAIVESAEGIEPTVEQFPDAKCPAKLQK
jgi:hypothetical protein